jgi:hypothetical protein
LFTRTTHTDKENVSGWSVDNSANSEQMLESIIEDNQVHWLRWVLFIVGLKFVIASLSDGFNIWASFINEWSFSNQFTILVELIFSLEISEEVVGHELLVIESEGISELFFSNSVEHVGEDLLISIVDQFINECSVTLMSPESNQE